MTRTNKTSGPVDAAAVSLGEPLLDCEAAAALLNVRVSWVRDAARLGHLPCLRVGRHLRFTRVMLEAWLAEQVSRPSRTGACSPGQSRDPATDRPEALQARIDAVPRPLSWRAWPKPRRARRLTMTGDDPRRQLRTGGNWDRMDRPPGWVDSLFAGRSHADREAEQDAMLRVLLVIGGIAVLLIVALNALFTMVGLQLGWWSVPAFAPLLFWSFACALWGRVLRPVEIDVLSWRHRLAVAGMLAVTMWLVWPLWAGPTAKAWKAAHGGITAVFGPRYPLGAVLGSSPIAMGLVAFLLLAIGGSVR